MIDIDKIKKIIANEPPDSIHYARKQHEVLKRHIQGDGFRDYLEEVNEYQNEQQKEARKKLATSNKHIVSELRRPYDNVFSAKGGSRHYQFSIENKEEEFVTDVLMNVRDGYSLAEYAEKVWFENYFIDPNGLLFIELEQNTDGNGKARAYITNKSITSIRDYKQKGNSVEWVVFEPTKRKEKIEATIVEVEDYWVVDEAFYYFFTKKNDKVIEIENNRLPNPFGKVPARLNSDIIDGGSGLKKSPLDNEVEILNKYLISSSVLNIAEFIHNYPRMWMYFSKCTACEGKGTIRQGTRSVDCTVCGGKGRMLPKDVVDVIEMKLPDAGEPSITAPAGYIQSGTAAWEMMFKSIDRTRAGLTFSHWGTEIEKGENETATGRFIDVQPVHNRLDKASSTAERMETWIATMLGEYYYESVFKKAEIKRGRRYLIETAKQIWENYLDSKTKKANIAGLDILMNQYLESEFKENGAMYQYERKKFLTEPFPHYTMQEVEASQLIPIEDKIKKLYFTKFWNSLEHKNVLILTLEELNEQLIAYTDAYTQQAKQQQEINNINNNKLN